MRNVFLGIAAASLLLPAIPAAADPPRWAPAHGHRAKHSRVYDNHGRYYEPRRVSSRQAWRGRDGRYYCRRENGTTGLIVGGVAGALAGRAIDSDGDRATGTILGAAAGALLGRAADRDLRCR